MPTPTAGAEQPSCSYELLQPPSVRERDGPNSSRSPSQGLMPALATGRCRPHLRLQRPGVEAAALLLDLAGAIICPALRVTRLLRVCIHPWNDDWCTTKDLATNLDRTAVEHNIIKRKDTLVKDAL
jgi:hypothetical protein